MPTNAERAAAHKPGSSFVPTKRGGLLAIMKTPPKTSPPSTEVPPEEATASNVSTMAPNNTSSAAAAAPTAAATASSEQTAVVEKPMPETKTAAPKRKRAEPQQQHVATRSTTTTQQQQQQQAPAAKRIRGAASAGSLAKTKEAEGEGKELLQEKHETEQAEPIQKTVSSTSFATNANLKQQQQPVNKQMQQEKQQERQQQRPTTSVNVEKPTPSPQQKPLTSSGTTAIAKTPPRSLMLDNQTLSQMNDRLRNEVAQLKTEIEHSERIVQMNMGRAPVLPNRAFQAEVTTLLGEYEKIRQFSHLQLSKMQPSNPKYSHWEAAYHLNTEVCRLVRDSFSYRGFQT